MLNAKLESYLARLHALPHEISAYIYIYILMIIPLYLLITNSMSLKKLCDRTLQYIDDYSFLSLFF